MYDIPILLVAFNRPDTTLEVFNCIKAIAPLKFYIALDGPRNFKKDEDILCSKVKAIVENIDWNCRVHYCINSTNKGAEHTISDAISWVLKEEEYVIILEDDIVVSSSFFSYMQIVLKKYKNCDQIGMVSGCNFTPIKMDDDYFFGIYGHTWGWGTWRRAWKDFDLNIEIKDHYISEIFLRKISFNNTQIKYYKKLFMAMKERGKGNNTWDYCWFLYRVLNNKLCIIPRVNLTSNIGVYGLHAKGRSEHHFRSYDKGFIIFKEPDVIERNYYYDLYHFEKYLLQKPYYKLAFKKIKRLLTRFSLIKVESKQS